MGEVAGDGQGRVMSQAMRRAWAAAWQVFTPSDAAWRAAAWALFALWAALLAVFAFTQVIPQFTAWKAAGVLTLVGLMAAVSAGEMLLAWLLAALTRGFRWALLLAAPPLVFVTMTLGWGQKGALLAGAVILGLSLTAGAAAALVRRSRGPIAAGLSLTVGLSLLGALAFGFFQPLRDANPAYAGYRLRGATLPLPNPGEPGPYAVVTFTYGSGEDRHRPEFGERVTYRAARVDGSKLDREWKGAPGRLRTAYWRFGPEAMPLQGRVWAPKGAGPFPLVLIVHGNHEMEDFSDVGYAYLGELLASQGFILVSVDENFLNSSPADQINPFASRRGDENDARAWLLLEHLRQWRRWDADPVHPLRGKADLDRIGLIGQSRGGEAVATAAAFNRLRAYPDDATLAFDYRFNIRGVAAISPADGQYEPRGQLTPLTDVNYFTIHGSLDGDVTSFVGLAQYTRATFTPSSSAFKASLYVKDANHGQFNTAWGRNDFGRIGKLYLDERPILDGESQRQVAKVFLSAFLRAALRDEVGYRRLLQDPRRGAAWLPDGYLAANYADGRTRWLARFEEDLDPLTAEAGGRVSGRNLSVWREEYAELKGDDLGGHAAVLAWDDRVRRRGASYRIDLAAPIAADISTDLVFALSQSGESTLPEGFEPLKDGKAAKDENNAPLDWTVVVADAAGREARLPLSRDQALYPQIEGPTRRIPQLDSEASSEIVLRGYRLPLAAFAAANPALNLGRIMSVRFEFDRSPRGGVVLDDVGLAPRVS